MESSIAALTIAGSDPSAGAGVQADLKTFAALGVYGLCAVTVLTAQNSGRVFAWMPVAPAMVTDQIRAAMSQVRPRAVKLGLVGDAAVVQAVADTLTEFSPANLVVDPVMVSSSGTRLLSAEGEAALRGLILPRAAVVTPNLDEASVLSGMAVTDLPAMREAARRIHALGVAAVVIKGGHLPAGSPALDLFYDGSEFQEFAADRQPGPDVHGTGCAFSAAIAAALAHGETPLAAVGRAKRFVTDAIAFSFVLGGGRPLLDHARAGGHQTIWAADVKVR